MQRMLFSTLLIICSVISYANIPNGNYSSEEGLFKDFKVERWGNEWKLAGKYKDPYNPEDFVAYIESVGENHYAGEGEIVNVSYTSNTCSFPIAIEVYVYDSQLYIRHTGPNVIPPKYNGCVAGRADYIHRKPYQLVGLDSTTGPLEPSKYINSKGLFTSLSISKWGGNFFLLTGEIKDDFQLEDFSAILKRTENEEYRGTGSIFEVKYTGNAYCAFNIELSLFSNTGGLYIKHYGPDPIPYEYNGCNASQKWFRHEGAYTPERTFTRTKMLN